MAKVKYYYDPKTLSYRKIEKTPGYRLRNSVIFLGAAAIFGMVFFLLADSFIDSPKEKRMKREIDNMVIQYDILNERIDQVSTVLEALQNRDDDIYRVVFEAEPIPNSIRKAGFGGANRYRKLEGFDNSKIIKETAQKVDQVTKQVYVQSKSFDEIMELGSCQIGITGSHARNSTCCK